MWGRFLDLHKNKNTDTLVFSWSPDTVRTSICWLAVCQVPLNHKLSQCSQQHARAPWPHTTHTGHKLHRTPRAFSLRVRGSAPRPWRPAPVPRARSREQAACGTALSAGGPHVQCSRLHCLWRHSTSDNLYSTDKQQGPRRVRDYLWVNL